MSEPNPNWVDAPQEISFLFMVPTFNHIHPRKRRMKFRRRHYRGIRRMLERQAKDTVTQMEEAAKRFQVLLHPPCAHVFRLTRLQRWGHCSTSALVCARCGKLEY